ncbi:MAG: ATP cone domain-containing protein [bacterium]|nr:ATP cone domain-containing protein [bacterium]
MSHIVKRKGHTEPFDSRKIYGSAYSSCRNVHLSEIQSEKIAEAVELRMKKWIEKQEQVSSEDIFQEVIKILKELEPDAAFMYETHRDIA